MATKSRFFTGIVYPSSAPENWRDELKESLGMWLISPLHSADPGAQAPDSDDIDEGNDEVGATTVATLDMNRVFEDHWHVMYCHGNTIGWQAARSIMPSWMFIHKNPNKFMVTSSRNLARYFCHLDQPEKQQFDGDPFELLDALNGFPLCLERQLTVKEERDLQLAILATMENMNLTEYIDVVGYFRQTQDWQAFDYVCKHHGWCDKLCASARGKAKFELEIRTRKAE